MDYRRIYDAFIADRLVRNPSKAKAAGMERHHIVPKCMGGSNDKPNLVSLTFSDHIFAHVLLAKIYGGKLAIALWKMTTVPRYQGRHTRLMSAALIAESRRAKGDARRGKPQTENQKAAVRLFNKNRKGQPATPALIAARRRQGLERIGKPAHPNSIAAASRSGSDRTPAQIARNEAIAAKRRGQPATPKVLAGVMKGAAMLRGKPWPPARRAAQDAKQKIQQIQL